MRSFTSIFIFTATLFLANFSHADHRMHINIKGAKQGLICDNVGTYLDELTPANPLFGTLKYGIDTIYPRDSASGLPTGKRQHKPFKIVKEWGPNSTPMLSRALTEQEVLDVELVSDDVSNAGIFPRIKLKGALITSLTTRTIIVGKKKLKVDDISFRYQKISMEYYTMPTDDWAVDSATDQNEFEYLN